MGLCPSRHRVTDDIVLSFIELGDLQGLVKFTPSNFKWSCCFKGSLPALHFAILQGMSRGRQELHLRIVEWMLAAGADPHHQAPLLSSWFTPQAKLTKLGVGPSSVEVDYSGHSAISLSVAWLKALQKCQSDNPSQRGSATSNVQMIQYFEGILSVIARAKDARRTQVSVDQGVINRWEAMRDMTDTHNVTFDTAGGAVTCHDIVLFASSPVLKAMLLSSMKEGALKSIPVEQSSKAGVALFLDILYMSSTRSDPDHETVLTAMALAHRWEVPNAVHILADLLRDMISDESFVAIAEAAVHQGPESLQRDCAMFASRSTKVHSNLSPAALKMLGLSSGKAEQPEAATRRRTF